MADNNESADNSIHEDYNSIQLSKAVSYKIIKMYSERPHLWNPQDTNYRVASMKLESWQEIADEFRIDVTTIRKKVNSLLASHRREIAKIKKGKKSNWFMYNAMNFMPNHIDNNDTSITITSDHSDTEFVHEIDDESNFEEAEEIQYAEEDSDLVKYFNVPPHEIIVKEESAVQKMPKLKKMRTIYVRPDKLQAKTKFLPDPMEMSESYTEETHEIVHPIENIVYDSPNKDGKDECDVFGEYIAKTLKKHSYKTRAMIKQAINNVIYEEEMRKYDTDSHVGSSRNN